jgi:lipoyl(octanoyl) transferase
MIVDIIDVGTADYRSVYRLQKALVKRRQEEAIPDTLVIAEHHPVFTIGRTGSEKNLLADKEELAKRNIDVIRIDRGGDITFHGPGQIVIYPIMGLWGFQKDVRKYISKLEEVITGFLSNYDIEGLSIRGKTGIWVNPGTKIGSVGIGISKWVTYHGASVNVNTLLGYFDLIYPCGIPRCRMASILSLTGRKADMEDAKRLLAESFENVFDRWRN